MENPDDSEYIIGLKDGRELGLKVEVAGRAGFERKQRTEWAWKLGNYFAAAIKSAAGSSSSSSALRRRRRRRRP